MANKSEDDIVLLGRSVLHAVASRRLTNSAVMDTTGASAETMRLLRNRRFEEIGEEGLRSMLLQLGEA